LLIVGSLWAAQKIRRYAIDPHQGKRHPAGKGGDSYKGLGPGQGVWETKCETIEKNKTRMKWFSAKILFTRA